MSPQRTALLPDEATDGLEFRIQNLRDESKAAASFLSSFESGSMATAGVRTLEVSRDHGWRGVCRSEHNP